MTEVPTSSCTGLMSPKTQATQVPLTLIDLLFIVPSSSQLLSAYAAVRSILYVMEKNVRRLCRRAHAQAMDMMLAMLARTAGERRGAMWSA